MPSRPFSKHGVVPLATSLRIPEKGDTADIKSVALAFHKEAECLCQHTDVLIVNKQVKGQSLAKRIRGL